MASHQHRSKFHLTSTAICMAGALLVPGLSIAQRTTPQTRITAQIDNLRRSTIVGSRAPQATLANDLGAVDQSMQLKGITLVFSPTPAQKTALDDLAATQQNPASPQYHRWLKPEQFAAKFGMTDTDIATVSAWLERQGFTVGSVSRSRNRITFSGNAGMVAAAFGGPLHNYKGKGETFSHMAPSADLSIPAALGSVIQSIGNLSSFRPHSKAVLPTKRPPPQYTAGGDQLAYLVPPDIATIYDVNPAYHSGYNGTGQTIAVVGQSEVLPQDLANFQTALGLTVQPQSLNLIPGTGASVILSGDDIESDLDLEYASAMAPGADVSLYYVGNLGYYSAFDAIVYVVDNDLAGIISVSYGACEPNMGAAGIEALDLTLEQAAVQGQTVVVAAGDNGSVACTDYMWNPVAVQNAPAADFPASSPWVVGLGGTQIPAAELGDPVNTTYWATSPDSDVLSSALSYIPEQVWNDWGVGISGGGGGTSIYEPQPIWQAGVPGISAAGFRLVPDISLISSGIQPGYLICSSDPGYQSEPACTNGFYHEGNRQFDIVGGTSVAAPIFAGLVAVLNQAKGYTASGQGLINPTLYSLASVPTTYASAFHDITDGNNACWDVSFCGTGPQNTDYASGVGYDEASGLGSIDFAALMAAWPMNSETPSVATTTILGVSSHDMQYGSPLTLTATVSGGTGAVSFFNSGTLLGPATLHSGVATLIPAADLLQPGAHIITATYDGDTGFDPSTSTGSTVTVTLGSTTTAFTASSTTPAFGSSVTFTAAVTTNGIPMVSTGFVQYWNNGQPLGVSIVGDPPYGTTSFSISTLPIGANPVTVSFKGNNDYLTSTSAVTIVNVGPAKTTTALAASTTSPIFDGPLSLTATVSAAGVAATDGTVTFLNGGLSIGTGMVSNGVATISLSSLPAGSNSIIANYGGTSSFAVSASAALVVTVMPAPTSTTLISSTTTATFGSPVTLTATVNAGGSAASGGAVNFLNGSSVIGTSTVSGGIATLHLSTLAVGSDSITASYGGTPSYGASASSAVIVNVTPAGTSTTLSSSTTTPSFGSSVTLTATVSTGGVPVNTGIVTFLYGGAAIGAGSVNGSGVATVMLSTLPTGSDSITATFGGTSNLTASNSNAVTVTVAPDTTTTTLSASTASPSFGATVTLTATVGVNGVPATSGVVTFLSNGLSIGAGSVNGSGVATVMLSTLPTGSDSITATFGGTSNFAASASRAVTVTVSLDTTTSTLISSTLSPSYGAAVTLTGTVRANGSPVTSGMVSFLNNGLPIGEATINNGMATITSTSLPVGLNSITVSFAGGQNLAGSTSSAVIVTVSPEQTTTTLSTSSTNLAFGSGVAFTATVENGSSAISNGVVTFLNGGSAIGTGLVLNGVATLNLTTLPIGANPVSAIFAGTSSLAASASSTVLVTVIPAQASTATTLIASSTTPAPGDSVMFTAVVTSNGTPVASGTVNFLNGGTSIGAATLYNGTAVLAVTTLPIGANSISASFGGISNFATSASNAIIVTVTVPSAPPIVTVPAPPSATPGAVVMATATFSAGATYSGTMMLTCKLTGPPAGAQSVPTCSINPQTLTLAVKGDATAVLSVQTTAASTTSHARTSGFNLLGIGAGGSVLAGLFMFCVPSRRRRLISALALVIVFATVGFTGCGGSKVATIPTPIVTPATTAGTYAFTVSGTDALNPGITASTIVSVTVQ